MQCSHHRNPTFGLSANPKQLVPREKIYFFFFPKIQIFFLHDSFDHLKDESTIINNIPGDPDLLGVIPHLFYGEVSLKG